MAIMLNPGPGYTGEPSGYTPRSMGGAGLGRTAQMNGGGGFTPSSYSGPSPYDAMSSGAQQGATYQPGGQVGGGPAQMQGGMQSGAYGSQTGATMPQYGGAPSPGNNTVGQGPGKWINYNGKQIWLPDDSGDMGGPQFQDSANNTGHASSGTQATPNAAAAGGYGGGTPAATGAGPAAAGGAGGGASAGPGFGVPGYDQTMQFLQDLLAKSQGVQAPQAGAQGVVQQQQASPAAAIQAALGQAQQAQASSTGPAAQSAMTAVRGDQMGLAGYLQDLLSGKNSVAGMQSQQMASRLLGQQASLAAGASPGNAIAARRMAGQQMGQMGGDLESNMLQAQQTERNAAGSQLQGLYGTVAGQDLGNTQFNANQSNVLAGINAQLGTSASIANAGYGTQASLANAASQNQMGMFNADQANNMGMFNAAQGNAMGQFNAGLGQQLNLANAGLQQNQTAQNNQMVQNIMGLQQGYTGMQYGGNLAQNQMTNQNQQNDLNRANQLAMIAASQPQLWQRIMSGGAGALGAILPALLKGGGGGGDGSLASLIAQGMGSFGGGDSGGGGVDFGSFLGGAGTGAAAGSMFGPIGTGIGAGIGGLASLFGF